MAYSDFLAYLEQIYAEAGGGFPKFASPAGELARDFARQFFAGATEVRLEYDSLENRRGYYNRYLVYVYALKDGEWINYNLEAVRAGWSPYFSKYGYSVRFHQDFVEAQAEAQEAQRGIWSPSIRHYPDYEGRLPWWNRRGDAVEYFRAHHGDDPTYVIVGTDAGWERLPQLEGQDIVIFGTLGDLHYDWEPPRAMIGHRRGDDFQIVAFRDGALEDLQLERFAGEYFYMRGRLDFYRGSPQFVADYGLDMWIEP